MTLTRYFDFMAFVEAFEKGLAQRRDQTDRNDVCQPCSKDRNDLRTDEGELTAGIMQFVPSSFFIEAIRRESLVL